MSKYSTAESIIYRYVIRHCAGDIAKIVPVSVTDNTIAGKVITQKQYGQGVYSYTIDRQHKSVTMRGHTAHYSADSCASTGGEVTYNRQ